MKKIIATILATLALFGCLFAVSACTSSSSTENNGSSASALQTEKKYIREGDVKEEQEKQVYYVFHKSGMGEYHYYYYYYSSYSEETEISHYTIRFKYLFVDKEKEAIACFFDSITYEEDDNQKSDRTSWSVLLTVSENVLMNTSGTFYINENYLEKIPNFGKSE